jgi:hypothetical protein
MINLNILKTTVFLISVFVVIRPVAGAAAGTFDHSDFDRTLKAYVDDKGLIDYNGIAQEARFDRYMESLKTAKVEDLSNDGQLAFWINAYNAVTIAKVIKWKPEKSVRETFIPGVWTSTRFYTTREHTVAGRLMSPDDIEHEILRKNFNDPRIHFAIICASTGCPPQPRFAYTEENVQAMLEEETREYLNSERGTRIDRAKNTLYLSKIFEWFGDDFIKKSGSVINFIKPYVDAEVRAFMEQDPEISYLHYDWALNAKEPLKKSKT